MLSSIAAFFWGSSTTTTASTNPTEEKILNSISNIRDDLTKDVITHDGIDDASPVIENILSTSSLSDEEAGWVFVNNRKRASLDSKTTDGQETGPIEIDSPVEREDKRDTSVNENNNAPTTRSRNIPNSALHASSVLTTLAKLRPQQKSERRLKERHLKRKQMERSNKTVHENSSSNRPNKRRSMYSSSVFSRAVNNRKC